MTATDRRIVGPLRHHDVSDHLFHARARRLDNRHHRAPVRVIRSVGVPMQLLQGASNGPVGQCVQEMSFHEVQASDEPRPLYRGIRRSGHGVITKEGHIII